MSLGNRIILTPDRGTQYEGIVNAGQSFYPGMAVQEDATQATQGNRNVCKLYARDATGDRPRGPLIIVQEDLRSGRTMDTPYLAGERFFGYIPEEGCQLNLLYKNVAGTADDVVAGDLFVPDNNTGKFVVTSGTPEVEVAMAKEAVVDPIIDTLVHCIWTGH